MEDPFIYRSLLFAIIEYGLMIWILYKGKNFKYVFAAILFFLASYQLGEFIFLQTGDQMGLRFAAFSTTLLPPLGFLLVENRKSKHLVYYFYQALGIFFALGFLLDPTILQATQQQYCLLKFLSPTLEGGLFMTSWAIYYGTGLSIAMAWAIYDYTKVKNKAAKKFYLWVFLAYASFFPASYFMTLIFKIDFSNLASLMCALAIIAAFIMTWEALNPKLKIR